MNFEVGSKWTARNGMCGEIEEAHFTFGLFFVRYTCPDDNLDRKTWVRSGGSAYSNREKSPYDLIAPWEETPKQDYYDGSWHRCGPERPDGLHDDDAWYCQWTGERDMRMCSTAQIDWSECVSISLSSKHEEPKAPRELLVVEMPDGQLIASTYFEHLPEDQIFATTDANGNRNTRRVPDGGLVSVKTYREVME